MARRRGYGYGEVATTGVHPSRCGLLLGVGAPALDWAEMVYF